MESKLSSCNKINVQLAQKNLAYDIQQGSKFTEVWHIMRYFASTLIWYHTHKQRHATPARAKALTEPYKYILKPPVMCSQQLFVFHWISNCWYQKFTAQISRLSLLFKHYRQSKTIRINKRVENIIHIKRK